MGNCLVLQEKVIKIMKMDGKILEYQAPLKVHQVLSEFAGHAISDTLPVVRYLSLDSKLFSDHLYYLLPPMISSSGVNKLLPKISTPVAESGHKPGVMRIKLVITKEELKEMITKGIVSVGEMVSHLENKKRKGYGGDDDNGSCKGWRPVLESIAEGCISN